MELDALGTAFSRRFGSAPTHLVRAPGQVVLLGEQLASHGLPVLALPVGRGVVMALRPREDGEVRVHDVRPEGGEVAFQLGVELDPDGAPPLAELLMGPARILARRFAVWRGFDAVLATDLDLVGGGLGGATALRTAVGLALSEVGEVGVEGGELAEVLAGDDPEARAAYATCLDGREGHALSVTQRPLRSRPLMLPPDWRVVVAPGGAMGGSAEAPRWREQRRNECAEALQRLGASVVSRGVAREVPASWAELFRMAGGPGRALLMGEEALEGPLLKRFRHLATELGRTREAEDALLLADLHTFGGLMDVCHGSLRGDYLVSSAALDATAATALEGGAAGAHLTGDGGWVVALADVGTVEGVLEALGGPGLGGPGGHDGGDAFVDRGAAGAAFGPLPG